MKTVVLGIGNLIMQDEGVGVRVIEALERDHPMPAGVTLIDGGTSAMEMLDELSDLDHLIVVDAINAGKPPGTLVRIEGEEVPSFFRTRLSPHQIGLPDVLASLEFLGAQPKKMVILGVQPQTMELGMELTPLVAAQVPVLVDQVLAEI
ncbi:MAG: HyaD/HybD family hydrogenase maturation endopeptidase [Gammaproteobacteria bacterium]|nr:HyaD/HybD family hydrogenase maturation endopeptidase [Gammaproteobacteria bacterium]MBU1647276.1 HyaD/HybD family hydrogenase maturation endopeptidase [Gammaproteobacteria bacterium]MBU1972788.1 HyaD/HybD family hydrogenase maturation endopeptidase [Gammaproteobacteria bacterium]